MQRIFLTNKYFSFNFEEEDKISVTIIIMIGLLQHLSVVNITIKD